MSIDQKELMIRNNDVRSSSDLEVSVIPYMRSGYFIKFKPKLTPDCANYLIDRLKSGWGCLRKTYFQNVSETSEIEISNVTVDEDRTERLVVRSHGKSKILDLPTVRLRKPSGLVYENRVCVALCSAGDTNSKVWSRLGLASIERNGAPRGIRFDELGETVKLFRSVNTRLMEFFFERLKSILEQFKKPTLPEVPTSMGKTSEMEALIIGTKDKQLAGFFKSLTDSRALIGDVVREQSETVTSRISEYFGAIEYGASLLDALQSKNIIWFSSPIQIVTESGYSELREVLFTLSEKGKRISLFGIGYDDSTNGELAHIAVNQFCLYLAKE